MIMAERELRQPHPHFAEYSLWNDSAYSMFSVLPHNCMAFTRPVGDSIFLSPADLEDKDKDSGDELEEEPPLPPEPRMRRSPGFERYMRRALKVVTRESLLQDPALFRKDPESEDSNSCFDRERDREIFLRPPGPRWRTPQQVHGRGRRLNLMQRRLEQALSQPARIERGSSIMQRMEWKNDALGSDENGTNESDPFYMKMLHAALVHSTAALPKERNSTAESTDSERTAHGRWRLLDREGVIAKKRRRQEFILNVLQHIREFVRNDLQIELFFEQKLKPAERKRIRDVVMKLMGEETRIEFDKVEILHVVRDIVRCNNYALGTMSKGVDPTRQICVYKEAPLDMFLVTPDDVRNPQPDEQEEETNPFLRSIAKHQRNGNNPDQPNNTILDRIIDFFVEFAEEDEYTEFRFLGAFNMDEIDVLSTFFGMITCLIEKRPYFDYPERLVETFEMGLDFSSVEDANGFVSIRKWARLEDDQNSVDKEIEME